MRLRILLSLALIFSLGVTARAQSSPYSNVIFKAQTFTATGQTGTPIQLNGLVVASTVGSSFASGTITVTGSSLTTVTFGLQGSSDGGATYYALPVSTVASPTTTPTTTITATGNGLYQVNLAGLTHVRFVTSGTFTATNVSLTLTASPNASIARNQSGGGGSGINQLTADVTAGPGTGSQAATVVALKGVPFCTGFTPTNGQSLQYTTGGSPNPCYTAATSGSASLPTAAQPGQIISSSAAGTTYAVQGQVFYSQSGDTVTSIEGECSSLCTYTVTTPQTITLSGDHTLSGNVQLKFLAGGKWTLAGGHVLTIPGNVDGTLNQHFAGSSVKFGNHQALVPVEWFGAVGDGTTDNLAAINATLSSLTNTVALFQPAIYNVSGTITIAAPNIGMRCASDIYGIPWPGQPNMCVVRNTSASADTVSITAGSTIVGNSIIAMDFQRSVNPTGTAAGVRVGNANGVQMRSVLSEDSVYDFYQTIFNGSSMYDCEGVWGFEGLIPPAGNYYAFYSTSNANLFTFFTNSDPATIAGSSGTFYGVKLIGAQINDTWIDTLQTNGGTYGAWIEYTGTGTPGENTDIHIWKPLIDHYTGVGLTIKNLQASAIPSFDVDTGYIASLDGVKAIDIQSSYGVLIKGNNILDPLSTAEALTINSSSGITVVNNIFPRVDNGRNGILVSSSTGSIISDNTFYGSNLSGAGLTKGIVSTGSTNNVIAHNTFNGKIDTAISLDATSNNNTGLYSNTYSSTITTTLSDAGSNPLTATSAVFSNSTGTPLTVRSSYTPSTAFIVDNTSVPGGGWAIFEGGSTNGNPGAFGYFNIITGHQPFTLLQNDDVLLTGTLTSPLYKGPSTAPSGSCSVIGWAFTQDGHASFCNGTTWVSKL